MSVEEVAAEVAIELVRAVVRTIGGVDRVRAILDAEYAAADLTIDVAEQEAIDREVLP